MKYSVNHRPSIPLNGLTNNSADFYREEGGNVLNQLGTSVRVSFIIL